MTVSEILFCGKREDNGEWITGFYIKKGRHIPCIRISDKDGNAVVGCDCSVRDGSIGQYVGLHDKNGEKIFTGDIVLSPNGKALLIMLKDFQFITINKKGYPFHRLEWEDEGKFEIIGKNFDNHELLTDKE